MSIFLSRIFLFRNSKNSNNQRDENKLSEKTSTKLMISKKNDRHDHSLYHHSHHHHFYHHYQNNDNNNNNNSNDNYSSNNSNNTNSNNNNTNNSNNIKNDIFDLKFDDKKKLLIKEFNDINILLKSSKQKDRILSLLKNPASNITSIILTNIKHEDKYNHQYSITSPPQQLYSLIRLYTASLQKLKNYHQPCSMEKHRAIYHILSNLLIQQELERFEPDFEPIGKKSPRKTRYISTLIDTPVECIQPYHHPVVQATQRKSFVETIHVITPHLSTSLSSSPYIAHDLYVHINSIRLNQFYQQQQRYQLYFRKQQLYSTLSSIVEQEVQEEEEEDDDIPLGILKSSKTSYISKPNMFIN
ncbi:unnamed protein product [Cunninghamella blakesleeana]